MRTLVPNRMEIKAYLRHLHIAPRKVRAVADLVRGKSLRDAERELMHRVKRSSHPLIKLLRSASANAGHNFRQDAATLRIKEIRVDPGPVQKRFRARAFGRAAPIRRRTSHVVLVLDSLGGAGSDRPAPVSKGTPSLREVVREDLRADAGTERSRATGTRDGLPGGGSGGRIRAPAQAPFMRRIFRRKAI